MIKRVETVHPVCVDSVYGDVWWVGREGISEIRQDDTGIIIMVNVSRNVTCVPWSNIRFVIAEVVA